MKNFLRNMAAVVFLALFLPYTVTLLINGRQGIRLEEQLSGLEYRVLCRMMQEDYSWMEDEGLRLMAVLLRTECMVHAEDGQGENSSGLYGTDYESYERILRAVEETEGRAVAVDGIFQELPYHAVSAGTTRDGRLLGEEYAYVLPVSCPSDLESKDYLQVCYLTEAEVREALGTQVKVAELELERDRADYVTHVSYGGQTWQGENFRMLLHLPSSAFWLDETDAGLRLTVRGSGHGFGISLYTANEMAKEGLSYDKIIQKFYQNAECITIP